MNITEKIKTFEDACTHLGIESELPKTEGLMPEHSEAVVAFYKLCVIATALNEGWVPDWGNWEQHKYFPWFLGGRAAFGSSYTNTAPSPSSAYIGSGFRVCYRTRELAIYAGQQFIDLYRKYNLFE